MKVGYISNIFVKNDFQKDIDWLSGSAERLGLNALILVGGISKDFNITLSFVCQLGDELQHLGIGFRYIVGNTDFYMNKVDSDKLTTFNDCRRKYSNNKYYLPTHPNLGSNLWIIGAESWYDYSLYRGKPISLSKLTKKRKGLIENKDVKYITDKDDYLLGINNTFDYKYNQECLNILDNSLHKVLQKRKRPERIVVVQYFYPYHIFLKDSGLYHNYFGAFTGSDKYKSVLNKHGVTDCVFGYNSDRKMITYDSIRYRCADSKNRDILEVDYNV